MQSGSVLLLARTYFALRPDPVLFGLAVYISTALIQFVRAAANFRLNIDRGMIAIAVAICGAALSGICNTLFSVFSALGFGVRGVLAFAMLLLLNFSSMVWPH